MAMDLGYFVEKAMKAAELGTEREKAKELRVVIYRAYSAGQENAKAQLADMLVKLFDVKNQE